MRISKPSKETHELYKGWHLIYPTGSSQSTKDGPPSSGSGQKLDEGRTPLPEEENPESAATGETP